MHKHYQNDYQNNEQLMKILNDLDIKLYNQFNDSWKKSFLDEGICDFRSSKWWQWKSIRIKLGKTGDQKNN